MINTHDISRDLCMLQGKFAKCGYDWWWHSFTGHSKTTGEERSFFIEFFVVNPAYGKNKPILGQLPDNKARGIQPSYLMVKVGRWGGSTPAKQLHNFYGWEKVTLSNTAPFSIKVKNNYLCETSTKGSVIVTTEDAKNHPEWMSDVGTMEWDLKIEKIIPYNVGYGAGKFFRALKAFNMFWHAEGMKSSFEGEVIFDGEAYTVDKQTSYGYSDKNWGSDFTSPWVWLSSNNLTSKTTGKKLENSVFDIGGGCPQIGFIRFNRKLLSAIYYEGKCFEFNFSKFWTGVRTKFNCYETDEEIIWDITQSNLRQKMVVHMACKKKDMLFINYESPKGEKKHNRLWNGGNGYGTISIYEKNQLIDTIEAKNVGCEYGEMDK